MTTLEICVTVACIVCALCLWSFMLWAGLQIGDVIVRRDPKWKRKHQHLIKHD